MPWRENEHVVNTEFTEITEYCVVNQENKSVKICEICGRKSTTRNDFRLFRVFRVLIKPSILVLLLMTLVLMILSCCPSAPRPGLWAGVLRVRSLVACLPAGGPCDSAFRGGYLQFYWIFFETQLAAFSASTGLRASPLLHFVLIFSPWHNSSKLGSAHLAFENVHTFAVRFGASR